MHYQTINQGGGNGVAAPQKQATLQLDRLNSFPLGRKHATSLDFSKVVPIDNLKIVAKDVIDLNTEVKIMGGATTAPVMSNIRQIVDTYRVPYQAIYGDDWENVIGVVKQKGDSCPNDARAWFSPSSVLTKLLSYVSRLSSDEVKQYYEIYFKILLVFRAIFADESILPYFNIHLNKVVSAPDEGFIGPFVSSCLKQSFEALGLTKSFMVVNYGDSVVYYYFNAEQELPVDVIYNYRFVGSYAEFLEIIENAPNIDIVDTENINIFANTYYSVLTTFNSAGFAYTGYDGPVNFEAIVAYQLVLADKFSNSRIDNIYTPKQFLSSLRGAFDGPFRNQDISYYIDGNRYYYSPVSNNFFTQALNFSLSYGLDYSLGLLNYLISIFSFGRPLRFGDYFTASRLEPLAQGDVKVTVQDGEVSAMDMNKKEWLYSFLYNLNIASSEFKDYIKGIFGADINPSRADIIRLVRSERYLGKESIENTGSAQFDLATTEGKIPITTALRGGALPAKLMYHSKEAGLLITVVWHDVEIYRSNTISRDAFVTNVEEEYIPELEFTGDQVILTQELDASTRVSDYFAWIQKYAEYKMRYSFVSGAFLGDYGNQMIVTDSGYVMNNGAEYLSSDFIRQSIADYNRFFPSNMFYTMPVHAYAIVVSDCNAKRPMYINPQPMR